MNRYKVFDETQRETDLFTPERNRWVYGMMLTDLALNRLTQSINHPKWMKNRLISGYGTITGGAVWLDEDTGICYVDRGAFILCSGREVIIPATVKLPPIPQAVIDEARAMLSDDENTDIRRGKQDDVNQPWVHLVLYHHDCPSGSVPLMIGDCDTPPTCEANVIQERFRFEFHPGAESYQSYIEPPDPDPIRSNRREETLNYENLVELVIHGNLDDYLYLPEDEGITLANIRLSADEQAVPVEVDNNCRPICYTNDLLFDIILGLLNEVRTLRGKRS